MPASYPYRDGARRKLPIQNADLDRLLSAETGLNIRECRALRLGLAVVIRLQLTQGNSVWLPELGTFYVGKLKTRIIHNVRYGGEIIVGARKIPRIHVDDRLIPLL